MELLRKALEWQALLGSGEVRNQAEIPRRPAITERALRPIAQLEQPRVQLTAFEELICQS